MIKFVFLALRPISLSPVSGAVGCQPCNPTESLFNEYTLNYIKIIFVQS